jgi:hypothetical protein
MHEINQIKKKVMVRQYETIPEQPMGSRSNRLVMKEDITC